MPVILHSYSITLGSEFTSSESTTRLGVEIQSPAGMDREFKRAAKRRKNACRGLLYDEHCIRD
jgi:hypothetical protein